MQVVVKLPELNLVAFYTPQLPRLVKEGRVQWVMGRRSASGTERAPAPGVSPPSYSTTAAGWKWRLSCLKFWLTQLFDFDRELNRGHEQTLVVVGGTPPMLGGCGCGRGREAPPVKGISGAPLPPPPVPGKYDSSHFSRSFLPL
jgi:hypothetical protein